MVNQPRKTKFRKTIKGRISGPLPVPKTLVLGSFGIQALEAGYVSNSQLEACRQTINRHLQRRGRIWKLAFTDYSVTQKPAEVRIGKGKGKVSHWVCRVRPGSILFELEGVPASSAYAAMRSGAEKLSLKVRILP